MAKRFAPQTPGPQMPGVPFPHVANALPPPFIERRDFARREALSRRILSEFTEMPGLVLTLEQAARLFGIGCEACSRILWEHIQRGQLRLTAGAHYTLASGSAFGGPHKC